MSTLRTFNLQHPESSNNNIQLAEGGGVSVTAGILTATNVSSTNVTTTEVTATNGTFSGNLSVSGVLTYEDTTNVDSVGVVTARSGIHVTGGSVGIGTDTIDANSQLHIKNTSGNAKITLETNETYDSYINFSGATSEASIGYEPTNNAVVISNAADGLTSAERLRITSAGESKFTVGTNKYVKFYAATHNDEADLGAGLAFSRPSDGADMLSGMFAHSDVGLGIAARDHVTILTGGTSTVSDTEERVRITSDGKVGINSITPTARLDINHPHTEQGLVVRSRYGNINTAMVKFDTDPDSNGGDGNVVHIHGGSSRTDSEILHINSTGEGTCFQIRGDGRTRVYKQLQLEHASNVPKIIFNEYGANDIKAQIEMDQVSGSAGQLIFRTQNSGTLSERLRIASDGKIHIGGNGTATDQLNIIAAGGGINIARMNSGNASVNEWLGAVGFKGYATGNSSSGADARIHAAASHNHSGTSAPADLIFSVKPTTTGPGSAPTERMRILNNGMIETNGVMNYYAAFQLANNGYYYWDIPVPNEGGYGNSFRCECGYNHYYTTSYGAHRSAWISSRGTSTNAMLDQDQNHSQSGAWSFSKPNNTTFRVSKSAGTYGGSGYGFIHVRFNSF